MNNKEAILLLKTIFDIGDKEIDDVDTALDIVQIQKKISDSMKLHEEAINKVVIFTEKEKQFDAKLKELNDKLTDENKDALKEELDTLMDENKETIKSIEEKNKKREKSVQEMEEKSFKITLPKIDRTKLPKSLKLRHYAALEPILK